MRLAAATSLVCATCAACGCGANPTEQVRAKVDQFARAVAKQDYATICAEVLAPPLIDRLTAAGVDCVQGMEIALGDVRHPVLSIGRITVRGRSATAITLTGAEGQQASVDAIGLVDTSDGWRVASLGAVGGG